jgi:hypothetical protein
MTNTLHRRGSSDDLKKDFIIFCTSPAGAKKEGRGLRLQQFARIVLAHKPVLFGSSGLGAQSWLAGDEAFISSITDENGGMSATFTDINTLCAVIADLRKADLGLCVNVSGLLEEVAECCRKQEFERHSAEHSLGIIGRTDRLPTGQILEIDTLCGHGMVSFNLIKKVIDQVKLRQLTPKQGAALLAKPCVCAAFNPLRAEELLERARVMS